LYRAEQAPPLIMSHDNIRMPKLEYVTGNGIRELNNEWR